MPSDEHPTCDHCGSRGYARYQHNTEDRWIDVCSECNPRTRSKKHLVLRYYHTINHPSYPADTASEISNPRAFIRS